MYLIDNINAKGKLNEGIGWIKAREAARERRINRVNDWADPMTENCNYGQWSTASRKLEQAEAAEDVPAADNGRLGAGASLDYPVLSYVLRLFKRDQEDQRREAVGGLLSAVYLWAIYLIRLDDQTARPREPEQTDHKPAEAGGHVVPAPWWSAAACC